MTPFCFSVPVNQRPSHFPNQLTANTQKKKITCVFADCVSEDDAPRLTTYHYQKCSIIRYIVTFHRPSSSPPPPPHSGTASSRRGGDHTHSGQSSRWKQPSVLVITACGSCLLRPSTFQNKVTTCSIKAQRNHNNIINNKEKTGGGTIGSDRPNFNMLNLHVAADQRCHLKDCRTGDLTGTCDKDMKFHSLSLASCLHCYLCSNKVFILLLRATNFLFLFVEPGARLDTVQVLQMFCSRSTVQYKSAAGMEEFQFFVSLQCKLQTCVLGS